MGLLQRACETYDYAAKDYCGVYDAAMGEPLAPVGHWIAKATIEITLAPDGTFLQASSVAKGEERTIYPVTTESAFRTSTKNAPHPLCEKLKNILPENQAKYEKYVDQLSSWANSDFSHPIIVAVQKYMRKATISEDLQKAKLLKYDKNGALKGDEFVRWIVSGIENENGACWKNRELFSLYMNWHKSRQTETHCICMVSGEMDVPSIMHPAGIVPSKGTAKLISSDDSDGCTYRGRFADESEALSIGYESSQKAHNALKWIIANQGVKVEGRCFVCWCPEGKKLPKPTGIMARKNIAQESRYTPTEYKASLQSILCSWKSDFSVMENAVTAVFDSATKGRLSLVYYSELKAHDFIDRLGYWDETCSWWNGDLGVVSPELFRIVDFAFGTLRKKKFETDDSTKKQIMLQLVKCRIDKKRIPAPIFHALVQRCGNLQIVPDDRDHDYLRAQLLFTACAVIRKYHIDYYKEEIEMALEPQKKDRSYQFGRLMAIMEKIEHDTYDSDEKREANIIRRQMTFVCRPFETFSSVMGHLKNAYYPHLSKSSKLFYEKTIEDIIEILTEEEYNINKPLNDTYLLGYYLQKKELYSKKSNNKEEE